MKPADSPKHPGMRRRTESAKTLPAHRNVFYHKLLSKLYEATTCDMHLPLDRMLTLEPNRLRPTIVSVNLEQIIRTADLQTLPKAVLPLPSTVPQPPKKVRSYTHLQGNNSTLQQPRHAVARSLFKNSEQLANTQSRKTAQTRLKAKDA